MSPFQGHAFLPKSTWESLPTDAWGSMSGREGPGQVWFPATCWAPADYMPRAQLLQNPSLCSLSLLCSQNGAGRRSDWAGHQGLQPLIPTLSTGEILCTHFSKSAENLWMSASELGIACLGKLESGLRRTNWADRKTEGGLIQKVSRVHRSHKTAAEVLDPPCFS